MQYLVTINMSQETVTRLVSSGYVLQVFRAVQASDLAGRPLLWMSPAYSAETDVTWNDGYDAYTSPSPITAGTQLTIGFSAAIEAGQLLEVSAGGVGEVTSAGHAGALSILNTISTYFTCGIGGGAASSDPAPFCAFPLYGNNLQRVVPLEKVLLMFSTEALTPGTVIDDSYAVALTAYGPGLLVDVAGATQRALSYDVNDGWSGGGYNWAQQVPAGTGLVPLLIEQP